jgi:hypothetical protein
VQETIHGNESNKQVTWVGSVIHIHATVAPQVQIFRFLAIKHFEEPNYKKKINVCILFLSMNFLSLMCSYSLWPTYIGEKGRTLGNTYGIKASCYREPLGAHFRNFGNILGTHAQQE